MRIAIAKPDFGVVGGFEKVMARVEHELVRGGHTVEHIGVDVEAVSPLPYGVAVPASVRLRLPGFVRYLALVEAFERIDARAHDLLITTQPPSFAIEHPRHLSLFSHHQRLFYDLCEVWIAAGLADGRLQRHAATLVRRVDQRHLSAVGLFLAASEVVRDRLRHFNGLEENVGVYLAGTGLHEGLLRGAGPPPPGGHVLCVTRQEFAKRAELFVHAVAYLPGVPARLVGGGGRLAFTLDLARRLMTPGVDLDAVGDAELWLNRGVLPPGMNGIAGSNLIGDLAVLGRVDDAELGRLYAGAVCVVAPAYDEDYGLTVIEAMSAGRPVVVCHDGGGVRLPVVDGVNGYAVEPTGRAIAGAVARLREDPALARRMGEAARETASAYTWERAMRQITAGVERLLS